MSRALSRDFGVCWCVGCFSLLFSASARDLLRSLAGLFNFSRAAPILAYELFAQASRRAVRLFSNRRTSLRLFISQVVELFTSFQKTMAFWHRCLPEGIFHPPAAVAAVLDGFGSIQGVPSRSMAQSLISSRRATATMAILFRLSLPRQTCS